MYYHLFRKLCLADALGIISSERGNTIDYTTRDCDRMTMKRVGSGYRAEDDAKTLHVISLIFFTIITSAGHTSCGGPSII